VDPFISSGELIGGNPAMYGATTNQTGYGNTYQTGGYTTTSNTYTTGGVYQTGYSTTGVTGSYAVQAPQVVNTTVSTGKEVIKGESRIEYVPF